LFHRRRAEVYLGLGSFQAGIQLDDACRHSLYIVVYCWIVLGFSDNEKKIILKQYSGQRLLT